MQNDNNFLYFMMGILIVTVGFLGFIYLNDSSGNGSPVILNTKNPVIEMDTNDKKIDLDITGDGVKGTFED